MLEEILPELRKKRKLTQQELYDVVFNMMDNWNYLEPTTKKNIFQSLYKRIVILKENGVWTVKEMVQN